MIRSDTYEIVKVISDVDASGATLVLETDIQNIQVEKVEKFLSIESVIGQVYKVSLDGQRQNYDLTNKIKIECSPYIGNFNYTESEYFSLGEDNGVLNGFTFRIGEFYESIKNTPFAQPSENALGYALQAVSGDQSLRITILAEDEISPMLVYTIPILLRIPQGLLDFNINAQNITAAIDKTGLTFGINGVKVINGGLQIVKKEEGEDEEEWLLYFNDGQLRIKGNGNFTGEISASSGDIANFEIKKGSLLTDGLIIQSAHIDEQGNNVPSRIQVQNISIGNGAYIEEYLQLGTAYIRNPNFTGNTSKIFIETYNTDNQSTFSLTDSGLIKLGAGLDKIILDGNTSRISGNNWSIQPDFASFNNVEVSGVINTAVFNQSSIQNVGSTMIFQDSAKIDSNNLDINGEYFQVEDNALTINQGDLIQLSKIGNGLLLTGKITSISSNKYYIQSIDGNEEEMQNYLKSPDTIITVLGVSGSTIFSISASNKFNSKEYLHPNALSLTEITDDGNQIRYDKKLVLGNLSGIQYAESPLTGYGLYCENVYLNGQIVGRAGQEGNYYYAGISTINDIKSTYFNNEDIIFWAGAKTLNPIPSSDEIPFYITTNGNLYASSGVFKGSLITDATITAASLKAAAIYPLENEGASLKIFNTQKEKGGISFREEKEDKENYPDGLETLNLSTSGFVSKGRTFIDFSRENQIDISATTLYGDLISVGANLFLNNGNIRMLRSGAESFDAEDYSFGLSFLNNGFKLEDKTGGSFEYNKEGSIFEVKMSDFRMNQSVLYGEKMRYQKAVVNDEEVGYDLYIDD